MELKLLDKSMIEDAAKIYAECFLDDPIYHWFFTNEKTRFRKSVIFFIYELMESIDFTYYAEDMKGLIVLKKPEDSFKKIKVSFMTKALFKTDPICCIKGLHYRHICERCKKKYMPKNADYVSLLCVSKDARHQGIARKMIEKTSTTPVFLETQNEVNLAFYKGLGFEVLAKLKIAKGLYHYALLKKQELPIK
ncbi:MAG: GNAT family N-acetyltransferase [Clostridia bacterium]